MARILVVEDDPDTAVVMHKMLTKGGGHQVSAVDDAERVIEMCRAGAVDLVLMDVSLRSSHYKGESVDGVQLTRMLKRDERTAHLPVLLVTAHAMRGDRERFLEESGADGYVVKPIDNYEGFLNTITELVALRQRDQSGVQGREVGSPEIQDPSGRRGLSHELRKLLFSLKGSLELILERSDQLEPDTQELVAIAVRSTNSLMRLTEEILTTAKSPREQTAGRDWHALGAAGCLIKPFEPGELLSHVKRVGLGGKKILVADDDPSVMKVLSQLLEARGYEVIQAFDGKAAVELAAQVKPDLLLLDLDMPLMDGYEVLYHLKRDEEMQRIPVLVFTGCDWGEEKVARDFGAKEYVRKGSSSR